MTTFEEEIDPLQSLVQPDLTTDTPNWCENCHKLRQEKRCLEEQQLQNFGKLKKKIISTDLLIKKYKSKCDDNEAQQKRSEEAIKRAEKFQRQTEILESQLKSALLDVEPLRKIKTQLEEEVKQKTSELQHLSDQLCSAKGVTYQYEALAKDAGSKTDNLEAEKKELLHRIKQLESGKVTKEAAKEFKSEISALKKENTSLVKSEARLEKRLSTVLAKNEQLLQALRENKLSPTARRKRTPSGPFIKSPTRSPRAQKSSPRPNHSPVRARPTARPIDNEVGFDVVEAELKASAAEMDDYVPSDDDDNEEVEETKNEPAVQGQSKETTEVRDKVKEETEEEDEEFDDTASLCSVKWTFSPIVQCLSPLPSTPVCLNKHKKSSKENLDTLADESVLNLNEESKMALSEQTTLELNDEIKNVPENTEEDSVNTQKAKSDQIVKESLYSEVTDNKSLAMNTETEEEYQKKVSEDLMDIFNDASCERQVEDASKEERASEKPEPLAEGGVKSPHRNSVNDRSETITEYMLSRKDTVGFIPTVESEAPDVKPSVCAVEQLKQHTPSSDVATGDQTINKDLSNVLHGSGDAGKVNICKQDINMSDVVPNDTKEQINVTQQKTCSQDNQKTNNPAKQTDTHIDDSPSELPKKSFDKTTSKCKMLESFIKFKKSSAGNLAEEIASLNTVGDYDVLSRESSEKTIMSVDSKVLKKYRQRLRQSKYRDVDGEHSISEANCKGAVTIEKSGTTHSNQPATIGEDGDRTLFTTSDVSVDNKDVGVAKGTPKIMRSKRMSSDTCAAFMDMPIDELQESEIHRSETREKGDHLLSVQVSGDMESAVLDNMCDKTPSGTSDLHDKRVLSPRKKSLTDAVPVFVSQENTAVDDNTEMVMSENVTDNIRHSSMDASKHETAVTRAENVQQDLIEVPKTSRQMSTGFVVNLSVERMSSTESLASPLPLLRRTPPSLPSLDAHSVCGTIDEEVTDRDEPLDASKETREISEIREANSDHVAGDDNCKSIKNPNSAEDTQGFKKSFETSEKNKQASVIADKHSEMVEVENIAKHVEVSATKTKGSCQGLAHVFPSTSQSLDSDSEVLQAGLSRSTTPSVASLDRTSPLSPLPMSPFEFIIPISPLPPSPCRSIERVSPLSSDQDSRLSADVEGLQPHVQEISDVAQAPSVDISKPLPEVVMTTKTLAKEILSLPNLISPIKTPETRKKQLLLSESLNGKSAFYKVSQDPDKLCISDESSKKKLKMATNTTTHQEGEESTCSLVSEVSAKTQPKVDVLQHKQSEKLAVPKISNKGVENIGTTPVELKPKDQDSSGKNAHTKPHKMSEKMPKSIKMSSNKTRDTSDFESPKITESLDAMNMQSFDCNEEGETVVLQSPSIDDKEEKIQARNVNTVAKLASAKASLKVSKSASRRASLNSSKLTGSTAESKGENNLFAKSKHVPLKTSLVGDKITLGKVSQTAAELRVARVNRPVDIKHPPVKSSISDINHQPENKLSGDSSHSTVKESDIDKGLKDNVRVPEEAPSGHDNLVATKTKHRLAHRPNIQPLKVQKVKLIEPSMMVPSGRKRRSLEPVEGQDKKHCKDSLFQRHQGQDAQEYRQMQAFLKSSDGAESFVTMVISDTNIDYIARQLVKTCIECLNQVRLDPLNQVHSFCEAGDQQVLQSDWPCLNVAERQAVSLLIYLLDTKEMGLHASHVLLKLWEGVFSQDLSSHLLGKISLARVFTALSAYQGDVEQARVLAYHIISSNYLSVNQFLVAMVGVWPRVLQVDETRTPGIVAVLEYLVTRSLLDQQTRANQQMLFVLQKLCQWSPTPVDSSLLAKHLIQRLLDLTEETPDHSCVFELTKALHLLSVREGWAWFKDNIVFRYGLQTMANKYLAPKINKPIPPQAVSAVVTTIGSVSASLSSCAAGKDLGQMVKTWLIPLMSKSTGDTTVRNCCFEVILELCPFHPPLLQLLQAWMGKNKPSIPVPLTEALEMVASNLIKQK